MLVVFDLIFCWYRISCLYPALVSSSLHGLVEFLNISLFADNCDNFDSIYLGSCSIMDGDD